MLKTGVKEAFSVVKGMQRGEYNRDDLVTAMREAGLRSGDAVLFQFSHESLGCLEGLTPGNELSARLFSALQEVTGSDGMVIVPAFSFSFERNDDFDPCTAQVAKGNWSESHCFLEYCRQRPDAVRSCDPNCSVVAFGPDAREFLNELPFTTFGEDSIYDRLLRMNGKICGIGVSLAETPFLHFVEEALHVPFRYKKLFTGKVRENGKWKRQGWITSVPIQASNGSADGSRIEAIARRQKLCGVVQVGNGTVYAMECAKLYELLKLEIGRDPWITARGPAGDPITLDNATSQQLDIQLSHSASMEELISALWRLPRHIVSDGYDAALRALSTQVPMTIHEFHTGSECWTWLIPEKWSCDEAWIETLDGRRLFSYFDNPLHVVSYSLPIDREVSREELFAHLHVHAELPDAIPFVFKYYERDWGLCCSRNLKDSLTDERYRVVVRSRFTYGTLKVGEVIAHGQSDKSFVLCAHLCHPAMVNDDLSGVVVGIKVIQELLSRKNLKYTYRFVILPETIGSVAYLSRHEQLIPRMIGGLFLEMLGLENPHALQLSFAGDSRIDESFSRVLAEKDSNGWIGAFRTVVGNDERQFNAPGVRVPMLSLSRVQRAHGHWPYYPEYHSSCDSPERTSLARLNESKEIVMSMIDALESDLVPRNLFKGEIFCSRFGLHIDAYENREGNKALFDIIFEIDGTRSISDIAQRCGISIKAAADVIDELRRLGLVEYSEL